MLNKRQKIAHNIILRALNLEEDESKTNSESDISRLQLLIGKGRSGKSYVLDGLIILLKENNDFSKDNYLVIVSTEKAASVINSSTLYLTKN